VGLGSYGWEWLTARGRRLSAGGDSPDKRVNAFPALVLSVGCIGRLRALRGTHLEAWEAAKVAGDDGRQRGAARDDGEQITSTGRRERGEEAAGEHPHRNAKLLECLLNDGERRSGGAASGRSAEATTAGKASALRVFRAERGLRLGGEARAQGGA
jgi:hypothetical protein